MSREHLLRPSCRQLAPLLALLLLASPAFPASAQETAREAVSAVLDDFHAAAADADAKRYLEHFTPEGVFLGTDDWERWPLPQFREYVTERFRSGGWTYLPVSRDTTLAGDTAWFDEIVASPRWGRFRGTGVLRRIDGQWKIAHYALSFLVPNERWESISASAQEGFAEREQGEN